MNLNIFKPKAIEKMEKELNENFEQEPVKMEDVEDLIKLINTAKETNCNFTLELCLEVGSFDIQSDNFQDIKLLKANKTQEDRLLITHTFALLSMDTTINVKHIVKIRFRLTFNTDEVDYGKK